MLLGSRGRRIENFRLCQAKLMKHFLKKKNKNEIRMAVSSLICLMTWIQSTVSQKKKKLTKVRYKVMENHFNT
jgi:hypothetical protein